MRGGHQGFNNCRPVVCRGAGEVKKKEKSPLTYSSGNSREGNDRYKEKGGFDKKQAAQGGRASKPSGACRGEKTKKTEFFSTGLVGAGGKKGESSKGKGGRYAPALEDNPYFKPIKKDERKTNCKARILSGLGG